jgi:ribonuclease D
MRSSKESDEPVLSRLAWIKPTGTGSSVGVVWALTTFLHDGDLPAGALANAASVAIDSETMGLHIGRDPLCVVQLSDGGGDAHVVQLDRASYDAPNLKRLLTDPAVLKIFHYGRFDIAMFWLHLRVVTTPVYCTKIASRLARTYTDRHGLKDITKELLGIDISKLQQSSDWGARKLSDDQVAYAASDVLHLHALKARLDEMLVRESRDHLARACFEFLPHRAMLDVAGWVDDDIFAHT